LTLDDDVASLLDKEARQSGLSFNEAVNRFLKLGMLADKHPVRKPFKVDSHNLGLPPGLSYDNVQELLDELDQTGR
jgi:hypothetical protein